MSKESAFERLYSTPTKASNNQRWDVFHQMEKMRNNSEKNWGVDEKTRERARRIASAGPPSLTTRRTPPQNNDITDTASLIDYSPRRRSRFNKSSTKKQRRKCLSSSPPRVTKYSEAKKRRSTLKPKKTIFKTKPIVKKTVKKSVVAAAEVPSNPAVIKLEIGLNDDDLQDQLDAVLDGKDEPQLDTVLKDEKRDREKEPQLDPVLKNGKKQQQDGAPVVDKTQKQLDARIVNKTQKQPDAVKKKKQPSAVAIKKETKPSASLDEKKEQTNTNPKEKKAPTSASLDEKEEQNRASLNRNEKGLHVSLNKTNVEITNSIYKPFTAPRVVLKRVKSFAVADIRMIEKDEGLKKFDELDNNESGKLSLAELWKGVIILWKRLDNKPAIMAAFDATDRSGDGHVQRHEFGYFLRFIYYHNNLSLLFDKLSKEEEEESDDCCISKNDFLQASPKLNMDNPLMVFRSMETNDGGKILFNDLCDYMAANFSTWSDEADVARIKAKVSNNNKNNQLKSTLKRSMIQEVSIPSMEEGMKIFDQLDENGTQRLSLAELDKGAVILYPDLNNKLAIMGAFKSCDRSGDGYVQRHEFGYFLRFIQYYNNLWSLFGAVDQDNGRRISKNEFLQASPKMNIDNPLTVFRKIDATNGGMILFGELCEYMAINFSTWGDEADVAKIQAKLNYGNNNSKSPQSKSILKTKPVWNNTGKPQDIIHVSLPDKEKENKVFDGLDEDVSGKLSLSELNHCVTKIYPELDNEKAILSAFKASDRDEDGLVDRDEFSYFLRYILYYNNLWSLFEVGVKGDNTQRISKDDFLKASRHMEIDNPMMAYNKIKKKGEKKILFDEICDYMATNHV